MRSHVKGMTQVSVPVPHLPKPLKNNLVEIMRNPRFWAASLGSMLSPPWVLLLHWIWQGLADIMAAL